MHLSTYRQGKWWNVFQQSMTCGGWRQRDEGGGDSGGIPGHREHKRMT
jgi:hypothetical protein